MNVDLESAAAKYVAPDTSNPTAGELLALGSIIWRAERITNRARTLASALIRLRVSPGPHFPFDEIFEKTGWQGVLPWIDKAVEEFDDVPWVLEYENWKKRFRKAIQQKRDVVAHADFRESIRIDLTQRGPVSSGVEREFVPSRRGRPAEPPTGVLFSFADDLLDLDRQTDELVRTVLTWQQEVVRERLRLSNTSQGTPTSE